MNQIITKKVIFNLVFIILLLFNPLSTMAQDPKHDQKITIQQKNISIENAFTQIEKQTNYSVAYDRSKIDAEKRISLSLNNATLDKALSQILKGTKLSYKINGYHIILIPRNEIEPDMKKKTVLTQTIRGTVTDNVSGQPIEFATVILLNSDPVRAVYTDSVGHFKFEKVPIGRYDIKAQLIGYEPTIAKEILVISTKESYNEIRLQEKISMADEVVIRPNVNKEEPLNAMILSGGRMISVEEASRFAGGFDDPARLVSSFAGVSGGNSSTALSIHGNSPQFLQWKLEGVEIPSPSHFTDMVGMGGGVLSALSSQVMGNSDFLSGAFPAEYSNAISGVFDMSMRNGNNQKYEHTFQVGILGIDVASEGPISRKNGSSYIFNYRYFNTAPVKAFMSNLAMEFQDLSFKLNFPTRKAGTFAIWGFGLIDNYSSAMKKEFSDLDESIDRQNQKLNFNKFATGINHKIFLGRGTYLRTSLAVTGENNTRFQEMREDKKPYELKPVMDMKNNDLNITFNSSVNKRFGSRHTNRTGVSYTQLFYDLDFKLHPLYDIIISDIGPMNQIAKGGSSSSMISAFSNSLINITDRLSTSIGITTQYFALNNSWTVEPRVSLQYKLAKKSSLSLAYGLHSKREKLDYYYFKSPETGDKLVNKDLDLAKAHHAVLSYNLGITDNIHLKVEPFYQYLYDIPVEQGTSFSPINSNLFFLDKPLVNDGLGINYGIDITVEQHLNRGYYWLFSGSVFSSKYKGGDGVWRNTRYNRKFITNAIFGKEWMCGKSKQNVISANIGLSYQGGEYMTKIDEKASIEQEQLVVDYTQAFSEQYPNMFTVDMSFAYKINKRKVSHEFAVKVLNAAGGVDQRYYLYNTKTKEVDLVEIRITIPNISYKIFF